MIGSLRHKLERLTPIYTADEGGGNAITWHPSAELWARIERLSPLRDRTAEGRRFLKRIAAEVRADSSLTEGDRLRHDQRDFEVVSIETLDERARYFVLIAEEVLPT